MPAQSDDFEDSTKENQQNSNQVKEQNFFSNNSSSDIEPRISTSQVDSIYPSNLFFNDDSITSVRDELFETLDNVSSTNEIKVSESTEAVNVELSTRDHFESMKTFDVKESMNKSSLETSASVLQQSTGDSRRSISKIESKKETPLRISVQKENLQKANSPLVAANESMEVNTLIQRPRRRRQRRNSICSLPVSTVSAFSAFTPKVSDSSSPPKRSTSQLMLNSSIMFGREFCYAVEAGLTTPILLSIGLPANMYSLVWVISPILGFIMQPIIGNISDRCTCRWGKRRPFILALALLLIIGITLFLNGEQIVSLFNSGTSGRRNFDTGSVVIASIVVTIVGVVIFDFSADFIEGPIRAYAMDVCNEEDVKISLLYQAIFTGAGGAFGYASGGISWTRDTALGRFFPTDRQVVYTAAAFIFIICCILNLLSIPEKNLRRKGKRIAKQNRRHRKNKDNHFVVKKGLSNDGNSTSGNLNKRLRKITDINQNYLQQNETQGTDAEAELLNALMRQNRNQLFEQYETINLAKERIPSVSSKELILKEKLRKTSEGGIGRSYKKHGKRRHSLSKHKKKGKRHSSKNNFKVNTTNFTPESLTYGTFIPDGQVRIPSAPDYASIYQPQSDVSFLSPSPHGTSNNGFSFPTYDVHQSNGFYVQEAWQHHSQGLPAHNIDVLAARATYPRSTGKETKARFSTESYSTDSDTESTATTLSSFDYMMTKISPYAAVDPGMKHFPATPQIVNENFQNASSNHVFDDSVFVGRKKISPDLDQINGLSDVESSACDSLHSKHSANSNTAENAGGLKDLIRSIKTMPKELKYLCFCHLLGWIAFLCMALFFTDFVGQVVMKGDPRAPPNSRLNELYRSGVEIGNWGLTINAASSSIYCAFLKPLIRRFGARPMYVFGYFTFGFGSCFVALIPSTTTVLALSSVIGIMSATLYTLPYLLVAQYHEGYKHLIGTSGERGIGTDCALVTCMIQLAQIITGLGVGALVNLMDTVTVTVATSSIIAFIGTMWAGFCVHY